MPGTRRFANFAAGCCAGSIHARQPARVTPPAVTSILPSVNHEPDPTPPESVPDPLAAPTPDQVALGLRKKFRRFFGVVLLAALLVVVIRGIYVVWQVTRESGG
jgi:hypothetical protein